MGTTDKYWRYNSEEDFYNDAVIYVTNHVINIDKKFDSMVFDKKRKGIIKNNIKKYMEMYNSDEGYNSRELLEIGAKIVAEDVNEWGEFSCNPNSTLKDIMLRNIIGLLFGFSYISILLIYNNVNICEDFLEDLIYVNSGLFEFYQFDDEHVNAVCTCVSLLEPMKENEEILRLYRNDDERLTNRPIRLPFNLNDYYGNDLISLDFARKYNDSIVNSKFSNQLNNMD